MANGYALPILQHIAAIAGTNPARKLSPLGFLQMLLSRMDDSVQWSQQYKDGHETSLKVKFRRRPLKSEVRDSESGCDVAATPSYEEFDVPGLVHKEVSFWLSNAQIRQYQTDASQLVKINPASGAAELQRETQIMKEVYSLFIEYGAVLLASINETLVTQMGTKFGNNVVTGSNAARALSFSLGTVAMQDALVQLMTDYSDIGLAKGHLQALGNDKYAAIIDLQKEEHLKKITAMLQEDSGYAIYWAVVKSRESLEERITASYSENMRRYIDNHTNWQPGRNVTIYPKVQVIFGQLFIELRYGRQSRRISFEQLEQT